MSATGDAARRGSEKIGSPSRWKNEETTSGWAQEEDEDREIAGITGGGGGTPTNRPGEEDFVEEDDGIDGENGMYVLLHERTIGVEKLYSTIVDRCLCCFKSKDLAAKAELCLPLLGCLASTPMQPREKPAFRLHLFNHGTLIGQGQKHVFRCKSDEDRDRWMTTIREYARPKELRGWVDKEGHVRKNWSRRCFSLKMGVLSYYEDDHPLAEPLGHINVEGCELVAPKSKRSSRAYVRRINADPEVNRRAQQLGHDKLIIALKDEEEMMKWSDAIVAEGQEYAQAVQSQLALVTKMRETGMPVRPPFELMEATTHEYGGGGAAVNDVDDLVMHATNRYNASDEDVLVIRDNHVGWEMLRSSDDRRLTSMGMSSSLARKLVADAHERFRDGSVSPARD